MDFADPKSDIAFKKVFGDENKKEILISFLNAVLELEGEKAIAGVIVLNPYQAPKIEGMKETTLDVRAKDKRGVTFIVEMQVEKQEYFAKRALYYTSKAYVSQISQAQDYPRLNQVIFIGILDFALLEGEEYLSRHLILNINNHKQEVKDFEFNFIELKKFQKREEDAESVIDKWIYFLKNAGDLKVIPEKLTGTKEIVEAFEVLDRHRWSAKELEVYDYWDMEEGSHLDALATAKKDGLREGIEQGIEQGVEQGIEQGVEQGIEQGVEQGIKQGIEQGVEQGIKQGVEQGISKVLMSQLERKFGSLPDWAREKIEKADGPTLEKWSLRLLECENIESLLKNR